MRTRSQCVVHRDLVQLHSFPALSAGRALPPALLGTLAVCSLALPNSVSRPPLRKPSQSLSLGKQSRVIATRQARGAPQFYFHVRGHAPALARGIVYLCTHVYILEPSSQEQRVRAASTCIHRTGDPGFARSLHPCASAQPKFRCCAYKHAHSRFPVLRLACPVPGSHAAMRGLVRIHLVHPAFAAPGKCSPVAVVLPRCHAARQARPVACAAASAEGARTPDGASA